MYKFEKLTVWQESVVLLEMVYKLISLLPQFEKNSISDQLRRASLSVPLNIAEGSGSNTDREFLRYLFLSKKSLFEVIALLKIIERLYPKIKLQMYYSQTEIIGKLLSGLIKKLTAKSE